MVAARTLQSAAALARSPWMCRCVSTASSWRVYGACTAFPLSIIGSIALSQKLQGAATATIALPRRPHCVHRRLPLRCEQTQQNGIKAASSLPPPLCVQALSTSSWLLNASMPGHSLPICMSSSSRMMQTLCTSFRDECVGGPQGVGEFGYGNGWTSTGGCSMVTIIGLCMSSGMKTIQLLSCMMWRIVGVPIETALRQRNSGST